MYTINFDREVKAEHSIGFNRIQFDLLFNTANLEVVANVDQL